MFHLSYDTPFTGEVKTLRLKRNPFWHGLGDYEDEDGVLWNIRGCIGRRDGKSYVHAHRVAWNPSIHDTSGWGQGGQCGFISASWEPYYVVCVDPNEPQYGCQKVGE